MTLRIQKVLTMGLVRRRRGRRGAGRGRWRRRQEGRERRRGRQKQLRWAGAREGWRRAEMQWVQRQEERWQSKGKRDSRWRLIQRKQGQGRTRRRCGVARSKTSGLTATASRAATGANRRRVRRGLCSGGWGLGSKRGAVAAAAWRRGETGVGDVARVVPLASGATPVALAVRSQA